MKTSLYAKLNHLFAALKQMKHVCLSFNLKDLFTICFMFDFQKIVFIV